MEKMFSEQIAKGVAYLDKDLGSSWPERIDLETLRLESGCKCIVGQLYFGEYWEKFTSLAEGVEFGFSLQGDTLTDEELGKYQRLTEEWKEKIQQLRKEREQDQAAWAVIQEESIDPREQDEEEFGTPNASYCNSSEPDHNGGWFCHHPDCVTSPDEDERLESSAQRWQESQADQDYWQQHQAPWQDHAPTCNCPACSGEEF